MLLDARNKWVQFGVPGTSDLLSAEERWGRFQLEHGDPAGAAAKFGAVLAQSPWRPQRSPPLASPASHLPAAIYNARVSRVDAR